MNADVVISLIQEKLGINSVLLSDQAKERFSHIWNTNIPLQAKALVLPKSTEEVAIICKLCHENKLPIIIHGGLTGLVGGTRSSFNDLVISLERLNVIEEIDENSSTITVGAGVILETIHQEVEKKGLFFPLSFGAKGSAQIGGCLATNAGGMRVLRYGMIRNLVLGYELVLADGTIITSLKKIIKDNSGYNLGQLFIGSEGTLGIITKAVLKLEKAPSSRNSAIAGFNSYQNIILFLKKANTNLSGQLSAMEIIWGDTFNALTLSDTTHKSPLSNGYKYYILVETLGNNVAQDKEILESFIEFCITNELCLEAVMAYSSVDLERFWSLREDVGKLNNHLPYQQHFDISCPIGQIDDYVNDVKIKLNSITDIIRVYAFGHIADGNIHFIIGKLSDNLELKNEINRIIYSPLKKINGSISAEHGVGLDKKDWLDISKSKEEIEVMKKIKNALDPDGLLNPGRIFE